MSHGACLERLNTVLGEHDWVVTGGLAVASYIDEERTVGDIDVVMRVEGLRSVVDELGMDYRHAVTHEQGSITTWQEGYASGTIAGTDVEIMAGRSQMTVDGQVYEITLSDTLFEFARTSNYEGVSFPVVPPEEVLIQKVVLGRQKDRKDIAGILEAVRLDESVIDRFLSDWQIDRSRFETLLASRLDVDRLDVNRMLS